MLKLRMVSVVVLMLVASCAHRSILHVYHFNSENPATEMLLQALAKEFVIHRGKTQYHINATRVVIVHGRGYDAHSASIRLKNILMEHGYHDIVIVESRYGNHEFTANNIGVFLGVDGGRCIVSHAS